MADVFWTDRGMYRLAKHVFHGDALPATFRLALCTNDTPPTVATVTLGTLSQIPAGNGYTNGGVSVSLNSTDFDSITEDGSLHQIRTQFKDFTLVTASGGDVPASGNAIRWVVLTDVNATVNDREVWAAWKLPAGVTVPSGQPLVAQNLELRFNNQGA